MTPKYKVGDKVVKGSENLNVRIFCTIDAINALNPGKENATYIYYLTGYSIHDNRGIGLYIDDGDQDIRHATAEEIEMYYA